MIITNNNTNLPIDILKATKKKMRLNKVKVQFEL